MSSEQVGAWVRAVAVLTATVTAGCANTPAAPADADPAPVRAAQREIVAALESDDPTAWVYLYTEDAVFLEAGGPPVTGRAALLAMAKAMPPLSSVRLVEERIERRGDLAYW